MGSPVEPAGRVERVESLELVGLRARAVVGAIMGAQEDPQGAEQPVGELDKEVAVVVIAAKSSPVIRGIPRRWASGNASPELKHAWLDNGAPA